MICRLCLIESAPLLNLFDKEDPELSKAHILSQHFWFELKPDDQVSTFICLACWNKVDDFHKFYQSIEAAHADFQEYCIGTEIVASDLDEMECLASDLDEMECLASDLDEMERPASELVKMEGPAFDLDEMERPIEEFLIEEVHTDEEDALDNLLPDTSDRVSENTDEEYEEPQTETNQKANQELPNAEELENKAQLAPRATRSKSKRLTEKGSQNVKKHIDMNCGLCEFVGLDFVGIVEHFNQQHPDYSTPYIRCCGGKFVTRNAILLHALKHENPEVLKCNVCQKVFEKLEYLRKHVIIKHPSEEDLIYECEHCDRRFPLEYLLKEHLVSHLPKVEHTFECEKCPGKTFASKRRLSIHAARHRKPKPSPSYLCHICAKEFRSKDMHDKHVRRHNGIIPPRLKCPIPGCYKSLATKNSLRLHILTHENAMLQCDECGSISNTAAGLAVHKNKMHKPTKLHTCEICGKKFKTRDVLMDHKAMHAGLSLNKCRFCEKSFTFRSNMYAHMGKLHKIQYDEWRRAQHQATDGPNHEAQTTSKTRPAES